MGKNRYCRYGSVIAVILLMLCICVSASAASKAKLSSTPKDDQLFLQWSPYGKDWQYPEIRDEGDRIIIEHASSLGFTGRAMQTYYYSQNRWYPQKESKKGNGLDQIILLKPDFFQLMNQNDDSKPRKEYPFDNNPDFDVDINRVKSPLKRITIKYNPFWTLEEGSISFCLWYKNGFRCVFNADRIDLSYPDRTPKGKDVFVSGFWSVKYDGEGRLTFARYYQAKTDMQYDYGIICEDPLCYGLTQVYNDQYEWKGGVWRDRKTREEVAVPKGINLNKLPFKVKGDPGKLPEATPNPD